MTTATAPEGRRYFFRNAPHLRTARKSLIYAGALTSFVTFVSFVLREAVT